MWLRLSDHRPGGDARAWRCLVRTGDDRATRRLVRSRQPRRRTQSPAEARRAIRKGRAGPAGSEISLGDAPRAGDQRIPRSPCLRCVAPCRRSRTSRRKRGRGGHGASAASRGFGRFDRLGCQSPAPAMGGATRLATLARTAPTRGGDGPRRPPATADRRRVPLGRKPPSSPRRADDASGGPCPAGDALGGFGDHRRGGRRTGTSDRDEPTMKRARAV
jgi:hypothetical protein